MLIEIHTLQAHAPANLNRDDSGAPKTAVFGGVMRDRVSSQCIKRSVRHSDTFRDYFKDEEGALSVRTRFFPNIVKELLTDSSLPEEDHASIVKHCVSIGKGESDEPKKDKEDDDDRPRTPQMLFLGNAEATNFIARLESLNANDKKTYGEFVKNGIGTKNNKLAIELAKAFRDMPSVDVALFGRMVTSPAIEDISAATSVAHAISTHESYQVSDFFTAVEDKVPGHEVGHQGAGFVNDRALLSAPTLYSYASLDFDQLKANLRKNDENSEDAHDVAKQAALAFINGFIHTMPEAKKTSTAAFSLPEYVVIEIRAKKQPLSYANAFLAPVKRPRVQENDESTLLTLSAERMNTYAAEMAEGYCLESERLVFAPRIDSKGKVKNIKALLANVEAAISK